MRAIAIVNPAAGKGIAAKAWQRILPRLQRRLPNIEWRFTECRGHATKIVRRSLLCGAEMVIAVGGDGTNNEIVKSLIVLVQDFFNHNPGKAKPGMPLEYDYQVTISEDNLVDRISMALNSYRRQKDRMADLLDQMQKIVQDK